MYIVSVKYDVGKTFEWQQNIAVFSTEERAKEFSSKFFDWYTSISQQEIEVSFADTEIKELDIDFESYKKQSSWWSYE